MKRVENDCCGCAVPAYPCMGDACPLRRVTHYYCDKCKEETTLYHFDDKELCIDCIAEKLEVVE